MASISANGEFHFHRKGRVHFFCPLCKYHQSTNTIKRFGWRNLAQLAIATITTTYLAFPIFGWKGISMFFVYMAGFEFFYRLRKRHALICTSCGFDPFLYKQDVQRARQALKTHWQKRIETENLFVGKKLKNYQTKSLAEAGDIAVGSISAAPPVGDSRKPGLTQ